MLGYSTHFSFKRGGVGRARKHAAYVLGAEKFSSREDVAFVAAGNMPGWSNSDPLLFWNAADENERSNGRTYHEFEFAIPRELTIEEGRALVEIWISETLSDRHPWTFGIHQKVANDGLSNIHCHLMFSDRIVDGTDHAPEMFFRRPASRYRDKKTGEMRESDPRNGGAGKDRKWNDRQIVQALRRKWEICANKFLSDHGHTPRLDLRSNAVRRLGEPEPKIGPLKHKGDCWRDKNESQVKAIRQNRRRMLKVRDEIEVVKEELRSARRERAQRKSCACSGDGDSQRPSCSPFAGMRGEQRNGRTVYRWVRGGAAGQAALVDRGNQISLCGTTTKAKVQAMIDLAKSKGWTKLTKLSGSEEFKHLAILEALREGIDVTDPELATLVVEVQEEIKIQKQHSEKTNLYLKRAELARRWLAVAAPINAIEAARLKDDPVRLMQIFETSADARRWELIERQRSHGVPESLLGFQILKKSEYAMLEGIVRHVGKQIWIEPLDRAGAVVSVPANPTSSAVRSGQKIIVRKIGETFDIQIPEKESTPRMR